MAGLVEAFKRVANARFTSAYPWVYDVVGSEVAIPKNELQEVLDREYQYEAEYLRKLDERLRRDLPNILALKEDGQRQDELEKLIKREERIALLREAAMLDRVYGHATAKLLEHQSPEGAMWMLGPAKEHTLECVALAGKWFPWEFLNEHTPPIHYGCKCFLVPLEEAKAEGLITPELIPDPKVALERGRKLLDDAHSLMNEADEGEMSALVEMSVDMIWGENAENGNFLQEYRGERLGGAVKRWLTRWPGGNVKGGEFRPQRGGSPGSRTKGALKGVHLGLPPLHAKQKRLAQWHRLGGRTVSVPEWEDWRRKIGANLYSSPIGTTQVFRNGAPLHGPDAEHMALDRPGRVVPASPGTLAGLDVEALKHEGQDLEREYGRDAVLNPENVPDRYYEVQAELGQRGIISSPNTRLLSAAEHIRLKNREVALDKIGQFTAKGTPPLSPGDRADALLSLSDAGYELRSAVPQSGGAAILQYRNLRHGDDLQVEWDGQKVTDATTIPPLPSTDAVALDRPPHTYEEFSADIKAFANDLGTENDAEVFLPAIRVNKVLSDHAGRHLWDGTAEVGADTDVDINRAGAKREARQPLSDDELRGVWSSYWVAAHEAGHGVNPISAGMFARDPDANLEEALAEELSHVLAARRLQETGQTDVLEWRSRNLGAKSVRGNYLGERAALGRLLDDMGIRDNFDRMRFLEDLKFRTDPHERWGVIAARLDQNAVARKAEADREGTRYIEGMPELADYARTMMGAGGIVDMGGTPLAQFVKSPGKQQAGGTYGLYAGGAISADGKTLHKPDGGILHLEKMSTAELPADIRSQVDGTILASYPPGMPFTEGQKTLPDGRPKRYRFLDTEARGKLILQALTGKGSPGWAGQGSGSFAPMPGSQDYNEVVDALERMKPGDVEWVLGMPVERKDGAWRTPDGTAYATSDAVVNASAVYMAPASPGTDPLTDSEQKVVDWMAEREKQTDALHATGQWGHRDSLGAWRAQRDMLEPSGEPPIGLDARELQKALRSLEKKGVIDHYVAHGRKVYGLDTKKSPGTEGDNDVKKKLWEWFQRAWGGEDMEDAAVDDAWDGTLGKSKWGPDLLSGKEIGKPGGEPVDPDALIPNYDGVHLKIDKMAGGSNGARFAYDDGDQRWLIKHYQGDRERVATEVLATSIYREMGADAPKGGTISWETDNPDYSVIPDVPLDEPKIKTKKGQRAASGIIVLEDDGTLWVYEPRGHFGGYENTFPKGGIEKGLSPQQNAHKELAEETGLRAEIVGVLGDYEGDTSVTRYYIGRRTGGKPIKGWAKETKEVKRVTPEEALKLLNRSRDQNILKAVTTQDWPDGTGVDTPPGKEISVALAFPTVDGKTKQHFDPSAELGQHYMTDALLANWDFVGMTNDNIMWAPDGHPIRIDQGGTLEMRAQGDPKPYGPVPTEVWTMLTKGQGVRGVVVSEADMRDQARQIADTLTPEKIDEAVDAAPFGDLEMRERIRKNMKARVAWMADFADGKADMERPAEGGDARKVLAKVGKKELTPEQEDALLGYLEGLDVTIDDALRSKDGMKGQPKPVKRAVEELDSAMRFFKTPGDVVAYIPLEITPNSDPADFVGKYVEDKGYLNADLDPGAVDGENAYMKVIVPEGSNALYTRALSGDAPKDSDLLLARGTRFKVNAVNKQEDGTWVFEVVASTSPSYFRASPPKYKPWKGGKGQGKLWTPQKGSSFSYEDHVANELNRDFKGETVINPDVPTDVEDPEKWANENDIPYLIPKDEAPLERPDWLDKALSLPPGDMADPDQPITPDEADELGLSDKDYADYLALDPVEQMKVEDMYGADLLKIRRFSGPKSPGTSPSGKVDKAALPPRDKRPAITDWKKADANVLRAILARVYRYANDSVGDRLAAQAELRRRGLL